MRITCDVIQDLMPSYVDGILSEDSQALVKEHMEACKECRKMLELMKEEQGKEQAQIRPSAASGVRRRAGETENIGSAAALKKTEEVSPEDDSIPETVTEVYYMSEEARKKSLELTELEAKGDLDAAEKIVDEMKQESKLIWSEQEDRNTASSMLK